MNTSRMCSALARILYVCVELGDIDQRATLLQCAGELLELADVAIREQFRADPAQLAPRLVLVLRGLQESHRKLANECEGELRSRAMKAQAAPVEGS